MSVSGFILNSLPLAPGDGEQVTMVSLEEVEKRRPFLIFLDPRFIGVPKAILSARLEKLVSSGILRKKKYGLRQYDYLLTKRGTTLWPIVYGFAAWGDTYDAPAGGPRRLFSHTSRGTRLDAHGVCPSCKVFPEPGEVDICNGPGVDLDLRDDPITRALFSPHRIPTRLV